MGSIDDDATRVRSPADYERYLEETRAKIKAAMEAAEARCARVAEQRPYPVAHALQFPTVL
jgi:hypothetical protein